MPKIQKQSPLFIILPQYSRAQFVVAQAEFGVIDELVVQAADAVVQCPALVGYTLQVVGMFADRLALDLVDALIDHGMFAVTSYGGKRLPVGSCRIRDAADCAGKALYRLVWTERYSCHNVTC